MTATPPQIVNRGNPLNHSDTEAQRKPHAKAFPLCVSVSRWFNGFSRATRHALVLAVCALLPTMALAQRNAPVPDPDPELERKTFILPEGFEVNLYAADPLLMKPIQMNR